MSIEPSSVIFIVGPTGAGKTEISIKLARRVKGEIICCDSMQIYKGMDILTGAPSALQRRAAAHHLFGIRNPSQNFSAADYRAAVLKKIKEVHSRGKTPVFVGGTGLYVQALLDGLFPSPPKDSALRKKLKIQSEKYGCKYLYKKLTKIDPAAASIIHPNDLRRIIRALEVFYSTGETVSQLKKDTSGGIFGLYPVYIFCLFYKDRDLLYGRINKRVDEMFEKGLVDEVKGLLKRRLGLTARQALGIKQVRGFLEARYGLDSARQILKKDTRRYAKRQMSWFRRDKRVRWIAFDEYKDPDKIAAFLGKIIKKP